MNTSLKMVAIGNEKNVLENLQYDASFNHFEAAAVS